MLRIYLLHYIAPFVGALALGLIITVVARRRSSLIHSRSTRIIVAVGAAVGILIAHATTIAELIAAVWTTYPLQALVWTWFDSPFRYTLPLIAGTVSILIMSFAPRHDTRKSGADLTRRSIFAFTPRGNLIAVGISIAAILALTVTAGRASTADDQGRYMIYWVDAGQMQAGTEIYGWYYSIASLTMLAALLGLTAIVLWRIAKPPFGADSVAEVVRRRQLSTFVSATTLGALLLHLSSICTSLWATASMTFMSSGVHGWSPFAALGPTFNAASYALSFVGVAIWAYIFWRSVLGASKQRN